MGYSQVSADRGPFNPDGYHAALVAVNSSYAPSHHAKTQLGPSTILLQASLRFLPRVGLLP